MNIEFINRGLLNIIEPLNIEEKDIKNLEIGESTIIITLKNRAKYAKSYSLSKDIAIQIK